MTRKYPASAWRLPDGDSAYTACKECSMRVMKFYEGRPDQPKYAALIRQDEKGHLLINEPTDKPYGKREARWLDPKKVRVVWIRNFTE